MPLSHGLVWGFSLQGSLREFMVVQAHIAYKGLLQILATVEAMGAQHIGDARVNHPVDITQIITLFVVAARL